MVDNLPNWFFSACAFIGFILCVIPLPWHLEAWNTGTCLYMVWTGLACLNQFINSVAWNSTVADKAPVWCDISAKFIVGTAVAIPASCLCINRRLYHIASCQTVTKTRAQKRRDVMIDLAIGLGLPALEMILQTVVQFGRYTIVEDVGCFYATLNTIPTFFLVYAWPIVIGLVSGGYAVMTIRELAIRRAQFKEFLSVNRSLNSGRYLRLMSLASIDILCTVPLATYLMIGNIVAGPPVPYISWANIHANFNEIQTLPAAIWRSDPDLALSFELNRYLVVFCALVFFAFFGFADEARKNYRLAYVSVAKRMGLSTGSMSSSARTWTANGPHSDVSSSAGGIRSGTIPVYITQRTERQRDSMTSLTSQVSLPDYAGGVIDVKKWSGSPTTMRMSGSMFKESLPRSSADVDNKSLPPYPTEAEVGSDHAV